MCRDREISTCENASPDADGLNRILIIWVSEDPQDVEINVVAVYDRTHEIGAIDAEVFERLRHIGSREAVQNARGKGISFVWPRVEVAAAPFFGAITGGL